MWIPGVSKMSLFHKHSWAKIKETYVPSKIFKKECQMSEYLSERLLAGITTLLFECQICHQIKKEEMLGK